jgi:formylglycine-generating enzyme required for sulfatase activity
MYIRFLSSFFFRCFCFYLGAYSCLHAESEILDNPTQDEIQKTVLVYPGKVILGDLLNDSGINELPKRTVTVNGFYLGAYQVTNAQYALWLNKAWKEGEIMFYKDPKRRGLIADKEGRLLCKILEADPNSQIDTQSISGNPHFLSMPDKQDYPVINVTWYGAQAYCRTYKLRLPTEAEWEKAAGMENIVNPEKLIKYRYGFSRNTIDKTWANYKYRPLAPESRQVVTTKVGFYNGINKLTNAGKDQQELTHRAVSPSGAYDMSGNVWEWVSDWYSDEYYKNMPDDNPQGPSKGIEKVAKGGCYDSLADGVRVAERMGLPPEHADIYTGFRVAAQRAEPPISVRFDQLRKLGSTYDHREIRIRGFLYQSTKGEWILAEEPNLKTCCIGSPNKAHAQIHLNKGFEGVVSSLPVLIKGTFFTLVSGNASGYRIEKAEVIFEEKRQGASWMTFFFLALSALVSYIGLSYFFRPK